MTRDEQVKALMERARDGLQEAMRTSSTLQTLAAESAKLSVRVVVGVTIHVMNVGDCPLHFESQEGPDVYVPPAITDLPDWMKGMNISLEPEKVEATGFADFVSRMQGPAPGPHWHVVIESLPGRKTVKVLRCSSWAEAESTMRTINASSESLIASIPPDMCHGDCPKVEA